MKYDLAAAATNGAEPMSDEGFETIGIEESARWPNYVGTRDRI